MNLNNANLSLDGAFFLPENEKYLLILSGGGERIKQNYWNGKK